MREKTKNKLRIILSFLLVILLVPSIILGANKNIESKKEELKTNTQGMVFTLNKKDTYNKSIFMGAYTNIVNQGKINGSVVTFSTSINNSGYVSGNIIAFAPEFINSGVINKSVIGFYDNMYLNNAHIKKDLNCYANSLVTNENTVINGDVNLYADDVILKGSIGGDVMAVGKSITINGTVNGNVKIGCNELVLGKDARIKGSLFYESPNPIVKTDESKVSGIVKNEDLGFNVSNILNENSSKSTLSQFLSYYNTLNKISVLLIAMLLFRLLPISSLKIELFTRRNVFKCLSVGAMTMLCVIPISFVLLMTIVGMPVAVHILSIYFDLTYIATIPTALVLGGIFVKGQNLSFKMLTGIFIMTFLEFLPLSFFSSIVTLVANLIGIGSIVMLVSLYLRFQIKRERTEYVTLMSINNSRDDIIRTKQKFEQMKSKKYEEAIRKKEQDSEPVNSENNLGDNEPKENVEDGAEEYNSKENNDINNKEDNTDE